MFTPCLLIREPEMIKRITSEDFKFFQNNDVYVDKDIDKLMGRNPFVLRDTDWKSTRPLLTPCFSPNRIKAMFSIFKEFSLLMVKFVEEKSKMGCVPLMVEDICMRYTLSNVSACALGIEARCFEESNPMVKKLAEDFLSPGRWSAVKAFVFFTWPAMHKHLKIKLVDPTVDEKFMEIVREISSQRKKYNVVKNDFLDSLSEIFRSSNESEDELNIIGQCASFFINGYESSSMVIGLTLFELANQPQCQERLRKEINSHCGKTGGELTYENVQEMTYLNACINEILRKNPVFGQLMKVCNEEYTYKCENPEYKNLTVTIEPGTSVIIPLAGIHNDEKYYSSPEQYIPDRFLEKDSTKTDTFFPFGTGQRSCMGKQFGLAQIKLGVVQLVKHFEITVNSKTQLPLQFEKWYVFLVPVGGLWLDFKVIEEN